MRLIARPKKVFLRLKYRTLEGSRVVLSEKDAGPRILKILTQAGGHPLSNRQIGTRLLPNAYHLSSTLNFIHRVLVRLQEVGLVEGAKLPRNPNRGAHRIWCWHLTPSGRDHVRHYLTQEAG